MLVDSIRVRIGELNSEGDAPNALSLKTIMSITLYQKHCPSTQVKIISSRKASLNFQAHWNFCSHSVSIKREHLLISYLLSCPVNAVLHYLLTQSSILPASIYAQLFCKLPAYALEHINATHSLSRENEEWNCGRECLGMARVSVFYLARGIPYGD